MPNNAVLGRPAARLDNPVAVPEQPQAGGDAVLRCADLPHTLTHETFFQNRLGSVSYSHDGESCTAPDDMIRHLEHQVTKLREESSHRVSRMPRAFDPVICIPSVCVLALCWHQHNRW